MRRAGRTDANQKDIVDALRRAGASVHVTSSLGGGFPDLVVGFRGQNFLLEIKENWRSSSTLMEHGWFLTWRGSSFIVTTPEEALRVIGATK